MSSVEVIHEYYEGPWKGLTFIPDIKSAEAIRKCQLVFRIMGDGFFVVASDPQNIPEDPLVFFAYANDFEYAYYTELPPRGAISHFQCDKDTNRVTCIESPWEMFREIQPHQPPCFLVEVQLGTLELDYKITLKAKAFRWKYILTSALPFVDLEIVCTTGKDVHTTFERYPETLSESGMCWLTKEEIALRSRPSQRFQLRESKTGKVILKRLPCANGKMLVKEKMADGQNVLAAEIYLNP